MDNITLTHQTKQRQLSNQVQSTMGN